MSPQTHPREKRAVPGIRCSIYKVRPLRIENISSLQQPGQPAPHLQLTHLAPITPSTLHKTTGKMVNFLALALALTAGGGLVSGAPTPSNDEAVPRGLYSPPWKDEVIPRDNAGGPPA